MFSLTSLLSNFESAAAPMISNMRQMGQMANEMDNVMKLVRTYRSGGNVMEMLGQMGDQNTAQFADMVKGMNQQQLMAAAQELARQKGVDLNQLSQQLMSAK